MDRLLNRACGFTRLALSRVRARLSGRDGGFVLLESIIAISIITVIMAAVGVEYVGALASTSRQRATQVAEQVANSTIEQDRALRPTDLVTGRDLTSVTSQLTAGRAVTVPSGGIAAWLANMDPKSDPNAASGAGLSAVMPTCLPAPGANASTAACTQQPGTTRYTVAQFLGSCWLNTLATPSGCVPQASLQSTTGLVQYLRVVVSVSWQGATCPTAGCYYVTGTLLSPDPDPTFKINQAPTLAPMIVSANQTNDIGDTVNVQLSTLIGTGVPALRWALTSGSLPAGLTMSTAGLITGTVTGPAATQTITVQVTDGFGRQASATFTWTVVPPPSVTSPGNQTTAITTPVNLALTTSCQNTPCTYVLTNAPTGLAISNTGVITGTPTVAGAITTSVTVTDAAGRSATTGAFTWTVLAGVATCPTAVTLPNGSFESPGVFAGAGSNVSNGTSGLGWQTNDANNQVEFWANGGSSQASNGNTPITAQSGTQWIEVNGAGMDTVYQDLPTTPGQVLQWSIWHRARNATNNVNAQDTVQVQMGSTSTQAAQVPTGFTSKNISDSASAWVNYTGVYTVPAGQTTTRFQVAAISTSSGQIGAGNFLDNVTVTGAPCMTTLPAAQTSTINTTIRPLQLTAGQGSGSYTWADTGSLPTGLSISSSGLITGKATIAGTTPVKLLLTDTGSGYQQSVSFTWTVAAAPTVTTPGNQTSSVGGAVSLAVASTCPDSPCTYSISGQPAGLSMPSGNVVTGTPTTAATSNAVTVTITDAAGATATTAPFTWTVVAGPTITTPGAQKSTVGATVNLAVTAGCTNTPCTYTLSGAPAGLTINRTTGVIGSSPTTAATYTGVTVTVTDAGGASATTNGFTWTVYAAPTVTSPGNQGTTLNTPLLLRISASCAYAPCSYALSNAPSGTSINASTGVITGPITGSTGTARPTVTVTDGGNASTSTTFSWTVYAQPSITAPANQSTVNNAAVSLNLSASCPNAPCAYALNGGPAGLTISNAGVVTGAATSAAQAFSNVTVTMTDSSGATATSSGFTWTVTTPLAGRWTFDESSGTSAADSAGSHNATLSGGYGKTSTSVQGANALTLNGTSGAAVTGASVLNTTSSFTVSAWVKLNSTSGYQTFVSQDGTNVGGFFLQYNPDTNHFRFYKLNTDSTSSAGVSQSSVAAPVVGKWYQLTGVFDAAAGTVSLFVNGVRQGSPVSAGAGFNATGNFVIGRANFGGSTNWVNGSIDDVRAYQSALSDDAVGQLAQAGYWRLNEGTGTAAGDSSLNGNNATLSGGATWTTGATGGGAVQFNGSSGAVTSSGSVLDTSQSYSISAWAKADSAGATGAVAGVDGTNVSGVALIQAGGKWTLAAPASDSSSANVTLVPATSNLVAGQWYQLAAVYDSAASTLALYVNGVLQGSPVSFTGAWKAGGKFVIGRALQNGAASNYFGGAIDDVHAYRFALDQAGVTSLAVLTPPPPATPTATSGAGSATVSWTAPTAVAGSPVTGYVVTPYLDGVAQTPVSYTSTNSTQTVSGLTTGGSYTFTVAAVNANGTSPPSARSAAVLPS